jgi:hypothetical protein
MLEIKNKNKFPVQVMIRSRSASRSFTTLIIPGVGAGKNVVLIEDEKSTPYLERVEKQHGLITTRHIPDNKTAKGE